MNNFNINGIIRENIKKMQPYSSARDEFKDFDQKMIFLDANENPFENGVNRYPDPQQKTVKTALTTLRGIAQNQILLGNGSDEVLDLLFRAFCEPNKDNVITLPPTYGMYGVLANLNAIENREIILNIDFQPDVVSILEKINENTKMIFLCSPNNPTGNSFSIGSILILLQQFKGLIVLDEAYIDFSEQESWLEKLDDYPNLVITQTLSKAYGMAGIRIGILYASTEIIAVLNKIKPPYNINELSQRSAISRIEDKESVFSEINLIKEEKQQLLKELVEIKFIEKIFPTDANFILIKVDDATKRYNQLLEKCVVIRNRTTQPLCANCLRITIGTKQENEQLIKILKLL
ncbi:histidinol-phosphate transaminase [Flavobacterium sp. GT3R68]|uniref:histidinol-phosphate transaminase n=1 Tax=Flavobacterium sp. GT3R68 TaxID=2594437 RepID=UPI000F878666|nr:histidinol-phosphate transaminase [Flavobacterium sp. GT3R68]RTY89090.1 histidinol-phosphate transaminase [Flavobacterium sp. GSN2]TRW90112.1 histidinol-phosphate transaminase [Flavobacterium sp. GT3R68]